MESTAEGVVISDCTQPDMPIIYVNNAFTVMTGYAYDEVVGKNCRFLQGADTDSAAAQDIRKAIQAQQPCTVEILNYRKDGTPFWNNLSITPVRDDDGRTTHFIGIQTDITRRREAEDALRGATPNSSGISRPPHRSSSHNCQKNCRRPTSFDLPGGLSRARNWPAIY